MNMLCVGLMDMPPFQGWIFHERSNPRGVAPGYMNYAPLGLTGGLPELTRGLPGLTLVVYPGRRYACPWLYELRPFGAYRWFTGAYPGFTGPYTGGFPGAALRLPLVI
jgi:hypothetical protein